MLPGASLRVFISHIIRRHSGYDALAAMQSHDHLRVLWTELSQGGLPFLPWRCWPSTSTIHRVGANSRRRGEGLNVETLTENDS